MIVTMPRSTRIGVISDTHGLLRPEALEFLRGSDRILHAGDIGNREVLAALSALAPVTAVRGNNDRGAWADAIPEIELLKVQRVSICVVHELAMLRGPDAAHGARVVVSGHSHRPAVEERVGVLYLNPGSAGPRRFRLPIAVAELTIDGESVSARWVELGA